MPRSRASGFGPAFAGAFRALTTRAPPDQRAAFVSSILMVAYLSFSLPAVAAGIAVTQIGLHETAKVYGVALIALAAVALVLTRSSAIRSRLVSICSPPVRLRDTIP